MDNINNNQITNPIKAEPKDVFLHLFSMVMLYAATISFVRLLFSYVEALLPDPLESDYYRVQSTFSSIRWAVSSLIIVFPAYLVSLKLLGRGYQINPEKRKIKIRKWLVYLTLFVAGLVMISDLVALIYNFLGGEITMRFVLKAVVVLIVAGAVFLYYFWDIKDSLSRGRSKAFAYIASALVLVGVIAGFFMAGSPQEERLRRFDERRVQD